MEEVVLIRIAAGPRCFDLLVLGRHGAGGALRSRLGRVAETAARDSEVPVLLLGAP
jgi:nucleotide-binding universal stress UspA family protein